MAFVRALDGLIWHKSPTSDVGDAQHNHTMYYFSILSQFPNMTQQYHDSKNNNT